MEMENDVPGRGWGVGFWGGGGHQGEELHTKYKLFRRRKHVQGECDFVLISFSLQPTE